MKKSLLFAAAAMMAGSMFAESVPVALLPEGVTANIDQQKNFYRQRNVTVAGSPQKGYYAFFAQQTAKNYGLPTVLRKAHVLLRTSTPVLQLLTLATSLVSTTRLCSRQQLKTKAQNFGFLTVLKTVLT